jgi:hypothetical protein
MKSLGRTLSAIAIGFIFICIVATKDFVAAQDASAQTIELEIRMALQGDPFLEAVFLDYSEEIRQLDEKKLSAQELQVAVGAIISSMMDSSSSALERAGDSYAIDMANKAAEVIDALATHYPEGCRVFPAHYKAPGSSDVVEVAEIFRNFREAERLAYEDGKVRANATRLSRSELTQLVTEKLGVSVDEFGLLGSSDIPAVQLCSILKRFWNVQAVPKAQRAAWARTIITMSP